MKNTVKAKSLCCAIVAAATVFMSVSLSACGSNPAATGTDDTPKDKNLYVLNYGEYIDESIFDTFESETGYHVVYEVYDSPESMYAKFKAGAADYDLICSSDYMIGKLIAEGRALKINYDNIPSFLNIDPYYMERSESFDPTEEYTIPYFWGTVGLIYDVTKVDESKMNSWSALWDEEYSGQIFMHGSVRDAFIAPLKLNGCSINTTDETELRAAQQKLIEQAPLVSAYYIDETKDAMIGSNGALGVIYSGDAVVALEANSNLRYSVPEDGSNLWIDSWIIPDTCSNKDGAEKFLDFLCRDDIAMLNFEEVYYSTPNTAVFDALDEATKNDVNIFPTQEILSRCEIFVSLGSETDKLYSTLWKEVKAS